MGDETAHRLLNHIFPLTSRIHHEGRSRSLDTESEGREKALRCISIRLAEKKDRVRQMREAFSLL